MRNKKCPPVAFRAKGGRGRAVKVLGFFAEHPFEDFHMVRQGGVGRLFDGEPFAATRFVICLNEPDGPDGVAAGVHTAVLDIRGAKAAKPSIDLATENPADRLLEALAEANVGARAMPALVVLVFPPSQVDLDGIVEVVHDHRLDARLRHDLQQGLEELGANTCLGILNEVYGPRGDPLQLVLG
ncbi:MAG: hypothetical protein A2843_00775 [Candidatus Wildermuthbacteria bacterium RIFCSPHIGHO2_01_FULL_48_27b]|uniref:Uncharacterized protein n=1 Tax=Candidatus Wildermuthbacteria bacterium RIFCSPHIGHO2_01_FULL_48_27b TaxID=1802447 RepID=A0A1G2QW20_9BACT|nr:MAG: hypothetical protein A2843_00775 [Candidatus Wildermuthbacteria bacterium RIFCSPHIGHO2_01_FULL_48_27b]